MVKTIAKDDVKEKGREKAEAKPDDKSERLKALNLTLEKIEKDFGKGSVMRLGDAK